MFFKLNIYFCASVKIIFFFRFLNEFLKKCKNILSTKLVRAKQTKENLQRLRELSTELETIEKTTKEVK